MEPLIHARNCSADSSRGKMNRGREGAKEKGVGWGNWSRSQKNA